MGRKEEQAARRQELYEELRTFLDYHRHDTGFDEGYGFNIKIYRVDIPDSVREALSEDRIDQVVRHFFEEEISNFEEFLKDRFPWIKRVTTAGRQSGWLVLEPKEPFYENDWVSIRDLKKRISDLHKIKSLVERGKQGVEKSLADPGFWEEDLPSWYRRKQAWNPRRK